AKLAAFGPVDLNRKLTDFRTYTNQPLSTDNIGNKARALKDRQDLAKDIFDRLRYATTGESGNITAPPGSPSSNALGWLAQLAVNIVDFIDNDDLITPFNWNPAVTGTTIADRRNGWVYGFEKPRLEMNEKYTRIENAPGDMGMPDPATGNLKATMPYSLRCWIELHNPITPQTPSEQSLDPMGDDGTHGGYRALLEEQVRTNPTQPAPKVP